MSKHYLTVFNKRFIVFLYSSFLGVFLALLVVKDQVRQEVDAEKEVVCRRRVGEGKEAGLCRREVDCGTVSVKASANSGGALRPG